MSRHGFPVAGVIQSSPGNFDCSRPTVPPTAWHGWQWNKPAFRDAHTSSRSSWSVPDSRLPAAILPDGPFSLHVDRPGLPCRCSCVSWIDKLIRSLGLTLDCVCFICDETMGSSSGQDRMGQQCHRRLADPCPGRCNSLPVPPGQIPLSFHRQHNHPGRGWKEKYGLRIPKATFSAQRRFICPEGQRQGIRDKDGG